MNARRALLTAVMALALCGCVPAGVPQAGYDTLWYRAFPTPTPTPTPTPSPVPAATATPTPAPQRVETDAFVLYAPYPYAVQPSGTGQTVLQAGGRQAWFFQLDTETASAALLLPLPLLSSLAANRLGDGTQIALEDSRTAAVAGRDAVLFAGSGQTDGQTLAVRAYVVQGTDACQVFVLSWLPADTDAETALTALLDAIEWK